jgi:hypothetical protein
MAKSGTRTPPIILTFVAECESNGDEWEVKRTHDGSGSEIGDPGLYKFSVNFDGDYDDVAVDFLDGALAEFSSGNVLVPRRIYHARAVLREGGRTFGTAYRQFFYDPRIPEGIAPISDYDREPDGVRWHSPPLPRRSGWLLCEGDLQIIDRLHEMVLDWRIAARDRDAIQGVAAMLAQLERIADGSEVEEAFRITLDQRDDHRDGLGAAIAIGPERIELSAFELVWRSRSMSHGRGVLHRFELSRAGWFDPVSFEGWLGLACNLPPDDADLVVERGDQP